MSPRYHIATDDGLISIQVRSETTVVDLLEFSRGVLAAPDYDPDLPLLADLRGMRLDLRSDALDPFNRFVITNFGQRPGSMAVVIDDHMSRHLLAAVYWLACAVGAEVFDEYDRALKWLIRREFAGDPPEQRAAGC